MLEELKANKAGKEVASRASEANSSDWKYDPTVREAANRLATEEDVAAMAYWILDWHIEFPEAVDRINRNVWGNHPGNLSNYTTFKPEVVFPLIDYLDERLDEQQAMLGLLVRYKQRCEWFNKRELLKVVREEQDAKDKGEKGKAEVEDVLKEDLYRYLHDQGINISIAPDSPRGRIDLILHQQKETRKYLEGKVFDNKGRGKQYIVKGFGQLSQYLHDYHASAGYLLIYSNSNERPEIVGDDQQGGIPFVRCENHRIIYILVIDIHEYPGPASTQPYKTVRISADELNQAEPGE